MKVLLIHCRKCNKGPLKVSNPEAFNSASSDLIYIRGICMKCGEKHEFDRTEALIKTLIEHE